MGWVCQDDHSRGIYQFCDKHLAKCQVLNTKLQYRDRIAMHDIKANAAVEISRTLFTPH